MYGGRQLSMIDINHELINILAKHEVRESSGSSKDVNVRIKKDEV